MPKKQLESLQAHLLVFRRKVLLDGGNIVGHDGNK
jgi:hypothetical protein